MYTLQVVGGSVGQQVSFPRFKAFNQLLGNLDIMEKLVNEALKSNPNDYVTKGVCLCLCVRQNPMCKSVYQVIQISVHFYYNSIAKLSWLCNYVHS